MMARAGNAGARGEISRRRAARVARVRGSARASCRGREGHGRGVTREGRDADARATPECRKRAPPLRGPFESSEGPGHLVLRHPEFFVIFEPSINAHTRYGYKKIQFTRNCEFEFLDPNWFTYDSLELPPSGFSSC